MHLALLFCVFQAQMLSAEEQAKLSSIEEQAQTLLAHGWFRTADADHDGSLSHQELVEIAKARQTAALEKLRLSDFLIFYASRGASELRSASRRIVRARTLKNARVERTGHAFLKSKRLRR